MNISQSLLFAAVSIIASCIGAISGIGGGIIIKPVLDMLGLISASTISFLSGCTVLSMTAYSIGKSIATKENVIKIKTATPLALGGALGGLIGKALFSFIKGRVFNSNVVVAIQSICLIVVTLGTLVFTINKSKIETYKMENYIVCFIIGCLLGMISSFLGIGGGPINLVVLSFFFSMDAKTASTNSLYIILFSQSMSLLSTIINNNIPPFEVRALILMVSGGIFGGIIGRIIHKKIDATFVDRLLLVVMLIIIIISINNAYKYLMI